MRLSARTTVTVDSVCVGVSATGRQGHWILDVCLNVVHVDTRDMFEFGPRGYSTYV